MTGAEEAMGESRSGWALCRSKDSSYPPVKPETKGKKKKTHTKKQLEPTTCKFICQQVGGVCFTSRCSRGKMSCSNM